jgi:hypothetical protein
MSNIKIIIPQQKKEITAYYYEGEFTLYSDDDLIYIKYPEEFINTPELIIKDYGYNLDLDLIEENERGFKVKSSYGENDFPASFAWIATGYIKEC